MSSVLPLGRLELASLREAWPNEALNFTPWLAEDDNLALLGEAIGLRLALEGKEQTVGTFSADILAKEVDGGRWVLIENQIEGTDHRHLGQLLTYAAGLDAHVIVWVAERFREEHRAALDFLNRATSEDYAFFGVQVELLRIGTSAYAPRLSVAVKPNSWVKEGNLKKEIAEREITSAQLGYLQFWADLISAATARYPELASRSPSKENWQTFQRVYSSGKTAVNINGTFSRMGLRVEAYLGGPLAKDVYAALFRDRERTEERFGAKLEWDEIPGKQDSRISFYMPGEQRPTMADQRAYQIDWLIEHGRKLAVAVRPGFESLDLSAFGARSFENVLG